MELFLGFTALEPVKSHVHCFCLLRLDVAVDNFEGGAVVGLFRSWWLQVSHNFEKLALQDCLACIHVECAKFGFGC